MDRILLWRLTKWVEEKQILSETQFGFRQNREPADAILWFNTNLRESLGKKMSMVVIFLDISKAFDSVQHKILHNILEAKGIQGRMMQWITTLIESSSSH